MFRSLLLAGAIAAQAPGLHAEPAAPRPDPLDARVPVPAPVYTPLVRPLPRAEEPAPDAWQAANARVARIGGWRAYAREAAAPAASAPARSGASR